MKKKLFFVCPLIFLIILCAGSFSAEAFRDELSIVGESFPPYKFMEKEKLTGIDIEVARYIFDRLGVKYNIRIFPWARCWNLLQQGEADVGLAVSRKMDREQFVFYPENHVWDASFIFLTNRQTKAEHSITSLDDVIEKGLKVGVIRKNSYHEIFWQTFPWRDAEKKEYHPQLIPRANIQDCLTILDKGRVDLYPVPKTIGLYTVKQMGLKNIDYYDFVIFSKPYPNVFSRASKFRDEKFKNIQELMTAYDAELAEFKKTPEFQKIFDTYEK